MTELMVSLRRLSKKNELVKGIMAYGKKLTRRRHRLNTSLVRLGERSSDAKTVIMKFCSIIWPRYVQSLNGEIQNVLEVLAPTEQSDDASIHEITDIVFCNLAYGFRPDEYFFFRLRDLSPDQRREFILYRDGYDYCYALNDFNDKHIFTDKYEAAKKFHQYFGRDVTKVEGQKDREEFDKFVLKHRTFMLKPAGQSRGQGIEVLRVGSGEALDKIFSTVLEKSPCVIEELIVQAPEMSVYHPYSVNGVRCATLLTADNCVEILFAFVKMGKDQRPIDNRTTGGLTANVDIRTGLVTSEGVDKFGQFYERHPDTDIVIKGAQIPKWDELCALVDELARVVPTVKYVGWDLALTPTGWVMIEGNSHGGFTGSQMSSLLGIKKDVEALIARA